MLLILVIVSVVSAEAGTTGCVDPEELLATLTSEREVVPGKKESGIGRDDELLFCWLLLLVPGGPPRPETLATDGNDELLL